MSPRSDSRPTKRRGFSLSARTIISVTLLMVLLALGAELVDSRGFAPFGYEGRIDLVKSKVIGDLGASAATKRTRIEAWLEERKLNALAIAEVLPQGSIDLDALLGAPLKGWSAADRLEAQRLRDRLHSYLGLNPAYQDVFVADKGSGRLLAAAISPPYGRTEDVSWMGVEPVMRIAPDGKWILATAASTASGAPLALVIVMDPAELYGELASDTMDIGRNLESAILDSDYHVILSKSERRFRAGDLALPLGELKRLRSASPVEVRDNAGNRLLAFLTDVTPIAGMTLRILTAADTELLEGPLRADRNETIALGFMMAAIGAAASWWAARRIASPLRRLEMAVLAFAAGDPEPSLPVNAPGDIGLIATAVDGLVSRVRDWRRDLENEVAVRTAELELRGAMTRAFASTENDEVAYRTALGELVARLSAEGGLITYVDGKRAVRAAVAGHEAIVILDRKQLDAVETAADSICGAFEGLGLCFDHTLVRRFRFESDGASLVLLGRGDRPFDAVSTLLLDRVLEELSPLMAARRARAFQEMVRLEAERALRVSEERLRTFFEESRDMIYTANADDVVASINSAGLGLLGLTDRFEVVGRPFSGFALSPEDRDYFLQKIRDRGFVADYEIVLKRSDGTVVFCIETAQAVKDRSGRVIEIQGIVKDITERINNERELWRANMELAEANSRLKSTQMLMVQHEKLASIGQLAAGIAHEINNPLGFLKSNHAVLAGFLRTLREAWGEAAAIDPDSHRRIAERHDLEYTFNEFGAVVSESDDGYRRIMDIVKNLKSFARGETEAGFGPYDLNKGIESTLVVARNEIKYVADVELHLGDVPPFEAMGGEINQVLLNILVNSAQAIEEQKRRDKGLITVETRVDDTSAFCVIGDNGPGIPEDLRLRIFDPFFTTKEPGKGTGLGLSISYDIIVNRHGGRLTVDQSPQGGARFSIELPLARPKPGSP